MDKNRKDSSTTYKVWADYRVKNSWLNVWESMDARFEVFIKTEL